MKKHLSRWNKSIQGKINRKVDIFFAYKCTKAYEIYSWCLCLFGLSKHWTIHITQGLIMVNVCSVEYCRKSLLKLSSCVDFYLFTLQYWQSHSKQAGYAHFFKIRRRHCPSNGLLHNKMVIGPFRDRGVETVFL